MKVFYLGNTKNITKVEKFMEQAWIVFKRKLRNVVSMRSTIDANWKRDVFEIGHRFGKDGLHLVQIMNFI